MKKRNYFKMGENMALGKTGTRWMMFDKSQVEDVNKTEGDTLGEKMENFAQGWEETLQFEHEVGKNFPKMKGKYPEEWAEARDEYFRGYVEGMAKVMSREKLKKVV